MINRVFDYSEQTARRQFDQDSSAIRSEQKLPRLESFARKNPAVVLAIGATLGVALGWWVKRK